MALAQARESDAILVTELTRWGRMDLVRTLQNLQAWNVSLVAQSELQFDLSPVGVHQSALSRFRAFANWSAARQARCAFRVVSQTYRMNRLADAECHKAPSQIFSPAPAASPTVLLVHPGSALTNGNGSLTTALVGATCVLIPFA